MPARPRRLVQMSMVAALVAMAIAGESPQTRTISGTVREVGPGYLTVVNDQTDPTGVHIVTRASRDIGGAATRGARVTVWYRTVGERYPVADRVLVHGT